MTSRVEVPPLTGLIHFFSSRLRVKEGVVTEYGQGPIILGIMSLGRFSIFLTDSSHISLQFLNIKIFQHTCVFLI